MGLTFAVPIFQLTTLFKTEMCFSRGLAVLKSKYGVAVLVR